MAAQKKSKASKFLTVPTRPIPVDRDRSVAGLLEKMEGAGFGAKQLAEAHRIWLDMLDDNSTIYLCGSGNLIPSGMRRLLAYVIKNRFVDVLVMSGTVLFHDIHETLGRNHYQAHPSMSDDELEASEVSRIGDMLANQDEYQRSRRMDRQRYQPVRTVAPLFGARISASARARAGGNRARRRHFNRRLQIARAGFLSRYCSAPNCRVGIARARFEKKIQFNFDMTQDTMEMMQIAQRTRNSGIITLGSICSQNMVNMAEISSYITRTNTARS